MIKKIYNKIISNQFDISINTADGNIFDIDLQTKIKKISSSKCILAVNPVVIDADPFLFPFQDRLFLFYEEQVNFIGKGVIKMTSTSDLIHWEKPSTVLEESFHLSYPNVFEIDGKIYMMPETGASKSIRLYEPNEDLKKWEHTHTILEGDSFVDSSIIRISGNFYLFTTVRKYESEELRLYFSSSLSGPWQEHPQSPVKSNGQKGTRCGGSIFLYKDHIYRPAQRNDGYYGSGIDIYRIEQLNEEYYSEELFKEKIIPCKNSLYRHGGHHFNFAEFKQKNIIATDLIVKNIKIKEVLRRLKTKLR